MKCPACAHPLAEGAPACPGCGLTRDALDAGCGVIPKLWKRASSPSADLTLRELNALNRRIAWFERTFPQVHLSVVAARTPQSVPPSAYAFWLINRAAFGRPAPPSRSYVVLFVLDAARGSLSLTVGYGLEKILPEPDLQSALDAGKSALSAGRLGKGVDASIRKLRRLLRRNLRTFRSERSRP